jgi:uncharacterized membrane protein
MGLRVVNKRQSWRSPTTTARRKFACIVILAANVYVRRFDYPAKVVQWDVADLARLPLQAAEAAQPSQLILCS